MRSKLSGRSVLFGSLAAAATAAAGFTLDRLVVVGRQEENVIVTPTGLAITPAGAHIEVADRPLGMVLSPRGDRLAVVTGSNFAPRALHLIDVKSRSLAQTIPIANSFVGVAFSAEGDRIFVGGGGNDTKSGDVKFFKASADGSFAADGSIGIAGASPSGLSLGGGKLYVALNLTHEVGVIDTATRALGNRIKVGSYPYTTVVSHDGTKVYVSNWGGRRPGPGDFTDGTVPVVVDKRTGIPVSGTVSVIDVAANAVAKNIEVGLHPSGMALSPSGDRLYVTNANSDTVSVIDTAADAVTATLHVGKRGAGGALVLGSAPNALAISPDGGTLFIANGAQNAVAVVDANPHSADGDDEDERSLPREVRGLIPTGWYPTAVALDASGGQLFIASGYGFGSIAPTDPPGEGRSFTDRVGVVSVLPVPDRDRLEEMTEQVLKNDRRIPTLGGPDADDDRARGPIPMHAGQPSPIKHVFYIIKENRTYDQVLGDMPQGNGDPSLVQFGANVTPNEHALAEQFVLFDNYYGPGDQSALGHRWILQAYPSDWMHKYGNGRNDQNPMILGPTDAIYDKAKARGLSVRAFGERGLNTIVPANATWTDIFNDWKNGTHKVSITARAQIVGLRDIYTLGYPAAESRVPDQMRADIFLKEFAQFEANGNLPNLTLILLYDDHTEGTSPGFPTPRAMVADNDRALGRIVDAISHSRFWKESAIFVTEDDSQDGLDHVDGHRTTGFVVSPYARRGAVDSHLYTIINMFRTIEQILGLPPMNQFDLAAEPMFSAFTDRPDFTPFDARPNQIPFDEMNPKLAGLRGLQRELAEFSLSIDSSEPDSAPADLLNRAIWHSVKGFDTPYNFGRPIRRSALAAVSFLDLAGF